MNKTLKTIGWICLALGVLGILADAGAFVLGLQFAEYRQTAIDEMREAAQESGKPALEQLCIAEDADGDGKPDGNCLQQPERPLRFAPRQDGRAGRGLLQLPRPGIDRKGALGINRLPIFLFVLGPFLAVVGAVILLVNREPKEKAATAEEENAAKTETDK